MEIDIDVYFWMVDRGVFDDDQRNKVDIERNKVKMHREHSQNFENGVYLGKLMIILKKSIIKISKKPFSLDPQLASLKENASSHAKQSNWNVVAKELKKFGIKVDTDKKAKIIEGRYQLICDILSKLFDFDNGGGPNTTRINDGNTSELQFTLNDRDHSMIQESPMLTKEDNSLDVSVVMKAPIPKKNMLEPIERKPVHQTISDSSVTISYNKELPTSPTNQKLKKSMSKTKVAVVDEIDVNKDLSDAESTLEFILLGLSKNLGLKPKQTLGLLSNNHKYLIHIAVKGTKGGDFSKITSWYQDLLSNINQLINLIDAEKDQNAMTLTLNIIKCGLFSSHPDLVQICCKVLAKIGEEVNLVGGELAGLAWDWFVNDSQNMGELQLPELVESQVQNGQNVTISGESGLQACIYALRRHSVGFIEFVLPVMLQFGVNNYLELFTHHLRSFFPDKATFMNLCHDIMHLVKTAEHSQQVLIHSQVLDHWIDQAIRTADFDGMNTPEERIASLSFLEQTWESKPDRISEKTDVASALLTMLKRGCRDRAKILRINSCELMFQLLHTFAVDRNQNAPILYKTLTFLLIEFHMDEEIREQMLKHFTTLFQQIQSMPVTILCEPLLKQIQISDGSSYIYNIFDFEFLTTVATHRRLNVSIAIQIVEIMSRVAINNLFFANSAITIMVQLLSRYNKDPNLHHCFTQCFKSCLQILTEQERQRVVSEDQRKQFLVQQVREEESLIKNTVSKYTLKKLQEQQKQVKEESDQAFETASLARKTKEKLIVNFLQKLITVGNTIIKQDLRMQLLSTYTSIEKELKVKCKPINYLLSLFGENIAQMLQYYIEHELPKQEQYQDEYFGQYNDLATANMQILSLDQHSPSISPKLPLSLVDPTKTKKPKVHEKVLRDIERIKSIKMEQTNKKNLEEELKKAQHEKQITIAKKKIEERKIMQGVASRVNLTEEFNDSRSPNRLIVKIRDVDTTETYGDEEYQKLLVPTAGEFSIISGADKRLANKKVTEVKLLDIRLEEQKDQDAVRFFVKKNLKVLKHLFNSYCFTVPGQHQSKTFDEKQNKLSQINVAEVIKLLKDFQITNLQVPKDDLMQFFRLVNKEILKKSNKNQTSLLVLDFEGFVELMLQLAVYIYSFEAEMTPVEYLQRLFEHFKIVAKAKKMATAKLFEDPDSATAIGDTQLISELNKRLAQNPNMELPSGFSKYVEKEVVNVYTIPTYFPIKESRRIAIEVLDTFLSDLFGVHILEPMSQVKEIYKVKPNIKHITSEAIPDKRYMQPIKPRARSRPVGDKQVRGSFEASQIRSSKNLKKSFMANNVQSAQVLEPLEVKPTLGVHLKVEVAKTKPQDRHHVLETAYVMEEMLQAVENGQFYLIPRQKMGKKEVVNRVIEEKKFKLEEEERQRKQQQLRLEQRKQLLKDQLTKMKEVHDLKIKQDLENKKKRLEEEKSLQRKRELSKQKAFASIAKEAESKRQQKQEEEQKAKLVEEKKRAQSEEKAKEKKQALKKKVVEMKDHFKKKIEDRQAELKKKEEEDKKQQDAQKQKREKMNKFYQEKRLAKIKEQQLMQEQEGKKEEKPHQEQQQEESKPEGIEGAKQVQ